MAIRFDCLGCGRALRPAPDARVGQVVHCPACGIKQEIPLPSTPQAEVLRPDADVSWVDRGFRFGFGFWLSAVVVALVPVGIFILGMTLITAIGAWYGRR